MDFEIVFDSHHLYTTEQLSVLSQRCSGLTWAHFDDGDGREGVVITSKTATIRISDLSDLVALSADFPALAIRGGSISV